MGYKSHYQCILLKSFHLFDFFSKSEVEIWWAGYNGRVFSSASVLIKRALSGVTALQPHCVSLQDVICGSGWCRLFRLRYGNVHIISKKITSVFLFAFIRRGGAGGWPISRIWVRKLIVWSPCKQRCGPCVVHSVLWRKLRGNIGGLNTICYNLNMLGKNTNALCWKNWNNNVISVFVCE